MPGAPRDAATAPPAADGSSGTIDLLAQPPDSGAHGQQTPDDERDLRWLMVSDVCKHCTHAACLDICPTGSLFRTEFGTVVVQEDICNGCGYCISACPYGVIDQRKDDGGAWKCTLCYDRLGAGLDAGLRAGLPDRVDPVRRPRRAARRGRTRGSPTLHERGVPEARLYGRDPNDGVGGDGAFFLLLDEPEVYGLPPDPVVTTRDLPEMWSAPAWPRSAMAAAAVARSSEGTAVTGETHHPVGARRQGSVEHDRGPEPADAGRATSVDRDR